MIFLKKFAEILICLLAFVFFISLIFFPETAYSCAKNGLYICASTVIPSLFPITFASIFIMLILKNKKLKLLNKFAEKILKSNGYCLLIFCFSLIGGYPTGAKLINEAYKNKKIPMEKAQSMCLYSVNSGAGFAVTAVGLGIFGSKEIGFVLYVSGILSAITLALAFNFLKGARFIRQSDSFKSNQNIAEIFTLSAANASKTVLSICGFVVLFSVINGMLKRFKYLKSLCFITEITSALTLTKNIYFIAFLLSFGSLSVLFQIISAANEIRLNIIKLFLARIFAGVLSFFYTFLILKLFKITLPTLSNCVDFGIKDSVSGIPAAISLAVLIILLIISLENKKNGGNLKEDLLK